MLHFINGALVTEQRYKAMERLNDYLVRREYDSWEQKIDVLNKSEWFVFVWESPHDDALLREYFINCKRFGWSD